MMGQYNPDMLLKWRGSMDLQLISDAGSASKYILGYTLKAEEDVTTARRVGADDPRYDENRGT